jgi:hypothetical protein
VEGLVLGKDMAKKFARAADESIILEASGVLIAEAGAISRMTGGDVTRCKLFLTSKRVVCARTREWFGGPLSRQFPILLLLTPVFWIVAALSKRTILFDIPADSLASFVFSRKKGRYRLEDAEGTVSVVVLTTFQRRKLAEQWLTAVKKIAPQAACSEAD